MPYYQFIVWRPHYSFLGQGNWANAYCEYVKHSVHYLAYNWNSNIWFGMELKQRELNQRNKNVIILVAVFFISTLAYTNCFRQNPSFFVSKEKSFFRVPGHLTEKEFYGTVFFCKKNCCKRTEASWLQLPEYECSDDQYCKLKCCIGARDNEKYLHTFCEEMSSN